MATCNEYEKYTKAAVDSLYETKKQNRLNELEAAYEKNRRELEQNREKLFGSFDSGKNALSAAYEKERMNANERAAANGLSSGAGTQAALIRQNGYQRDMAQLDSANAAALAEADNKLAELDMSYRSSISAALADNDYQKATALLQQYKDSYANQLKTAGLMAGYGDFSGYGDIYGDNAAADMQSYWIASKPELAYRLGMIDAEKYRALTGKYPK